MNLKPQRSTYGQTIGFMRNLFQDLLRAGYNHVMLLPLSLSQALLLRYGSEANINQELGPGTFKDVRSEVSAKSPWRKPWKRVIAEQIAIYQTVLNKQEAAIDGLKDKVSECIAVGVQDSEIMRKVMKFLNHRDFRKVQPQR